MGVFATQHQPQPYVPPLEWTDDAKDDPSSRVGPTLLGGLPLDGQPQIQSRPFSVDRETSDNIMSDASPEPLQDGQQIAQAGARPPRRVGPGGRDVTPTEDLRANNFESHLRAIEKVEPNNPNLTRITTPGWIPSQRDVDRIHEE